LATTFALARCHCSSLQSDVAHPDPLSCPTRRSSISMPARSRSLRERDSHDAAEGQDLRAGDQILHPSPGGHTEQIDGRKEGDESDRKSTRLNSSHGSISYAVFCLKKHNARICLRYP